MKFLLKNLLVVLGIFPGILDAKTLYVSLGDPTLIYNLGQVFVDGTMYIQKPFMNEMETTAGTWFYEKNTGSLFIHFEDNHPAEHVVEITTRRRIFTPHKRQLGYIVVEGFIMEHCGNQYPTNFWEPEHPEWQQAGAIGTRSGHHWVIKNNVIRFANGPGIDFGNEGNAAYDLETGYNGTATGSKYHVIDSNYITDNGGAGTAAYFPDYITFTNNVVERNNNLLFTGKKRWESAGVKMHGPDYAVISKNLIRNNYSVQGLWLDQGSGRDTRVHGNLITGNAVGFDLEIGADAYPHKLILDNNVLIGNEKGIVSRNAGGMTAIHNLAITTEEGVYGIRDFVDPNRGGNWSADHLYYFNNVIAGYDLITSVTPPDQEEAGDRLFDYNAYEAGPDETKFRIHAGSWSPTSFQEWQNSWKIYNENACADLNSRLVGQFDPVFDENALTLNIQITPEFIESEAMQHSKVDKDFWGQPIPKDDTALPGPFQHLQAGDTLLSLWSGLKPLEKYEDPFEDGNSTAVHETGSRDFQVNVFPNPTNGFVQVQIASLQRGNNCEVMISLYDLSGNLLFQRLKNDPDGRGNLSLDISGINPGVYVLDIQSSQFQKTEKVVFVSL